MLPASSAIAFSELTIFPLQRINSGSNSYWEEKYMQCMGARCNEEMEDSRLPSTLRLRDKKQKDTKNEEASQI